MVICLFLSSPVAPADTTSEAEYPDRTDTPQDAGEKRRGDFVAVPIPISNPTIGSGLGVIGIYVFHLNPQDEVSPPSILGAGGFYTDSQSWAGGLMQKLYLKEDRYRVTGALAGFEINYDFFGVGNEAGDNGISVPLQQKGPYVSIDFLRRVPKNVFVGLRYKIIDTDLALDLSKVRDFLGIDIPDIELNATIASLGPHVLHDVRDNEFFPTAGSLFDLEGEFYEDLWGSDLEYQKYFISYNRYWTALKGVLAYRAYGCDTGGDVPFFDLCLFGMQSDLRGYTGGRYRDRTMLATQLEYRRMYDNRLGYVAFGGIGQVGPSFSDYTSDDILPSAGVGFRWTASTDYRINLRVDFAFGKDEEAVYVAIGEAF